VPLSASRLENLIALPFRTLLSIHKKNGIKSKRRKYCGDANSKKPPGYGILILFSPPQFLPLIELAPRVALSVEQTFLHPQAPQHSHCAVARTLQI
jgi:hypothetical protein